MSASQTNILNKLYIGFRLLYDKRDKFYYWDNSKMGAAHKTSVECLIKKMFVTVEQGCICTITELGIQRIKQIKTN